MQQSNASTTPIPLTPLPNRERLAKLTENAVQPPSGQGGRVEEGWSWHSRVFPIRFTLEEVPLGEITSFQVTRGDKECQGWLSA